VYGFAMSFYGVMNITRTLLESQEDERMIEIIAATHDIGFRVNAEILQVPLDRLVG
jgi:hypothetical protein